MASGTAPTATTCGTGPNLYTTSTDNVGRIGASSTPCLITFGYAWNSAPVCFAQDDTNAIKTKMYATTSQSTMTLGFASGTIAAKDVLSWLCLGSSK